MVKQPSSTLKRILLQSFNSGPIAETSFYASNRDKDILRRYVFSLCFFHAVIIERRKFGPIGWKEYYTFSEADLHLSLKQMDELLNNANETPFEAIRYLIGECNYGGEIQDELDRLLLSTLLSDFICPKIEVEFHPDLTEGSSSFYLPVGG
ncbi:hypothetical protein J437_LFUL003999, partial [Ladona fulva]